MKILKFTAIIFVGFVGFVSFGLSAEEGMPQLNPKFWISQIFWLIVTFTILYIVLWKAILPKITSNIESRKSKIVDDLHKVEKYKEEAQKKLSEYEKIIDNSKKNAQKIIFENKTKLEKNISDKRKKIGEEINKELKLVENDILDFKKKSIENIEKISIEISSEITQKVLNAGVNLSSVSAIVKDISKKKIGKYL